MIIQITYDSVLSFKLDTESTDKNGDHIKYVINQCSKMIPTCLRFTKM